MRIEVTQAHIKNGKRQRCVACPVALAMTDAGIEDAFAGPSDLMGVLTNQIFSVDTPTEVRDFMRLFDGGRTVKPFSFEIEI